MRTERFRRFAVWIRAASGLIATALILARYLPTTVFTPLDWPDGGWTLGINVAVQKGMAFGRDLIFTYGPYGALVSNAYHPAVRHLLVGGGLVFGFAFAAGLAACERRAGMIAAALAMPLVQWNDSLLFALPVPALFAMAAHRQSSAISWRLRLAIYLLVPALALLPLTKLSLLPVSLLGLAGVCLFFWRTGLRQWALVTPAAFILLLMSFWAAVGQDLTVLPSYFENGLRIIGGYTDAMALHGHRLPAVRALLAACGFVAMAACQARSYGRGPARALIAGLVLLTFLVFKAGFVRQDPSHESDYFASMALLFLSIAAALSPMRSVTAVAAGLLCAGWSINPSHPVAAVVLVTEHGTQGELRNAWRLFFHPDFLNRDFAKAVADIPHLPWSPRGTTDLYGDRLARLLAAGLDWAPRPVLESYSAYTPALAHLNADHLRSRNAADTIFFQPGAIDGRLPSLEDGPSWPLLLSLYDPIAYDWASDMILLRRTADDVKPAEPGVPSLEIRAALGARVAVPPSDHVLWAKVDLRKTMAGAALAALWKPPPVFIHLQFADKSERIFRFIPGMGRAGFILSPLVESSLDVLSLRPGLQRALHRPVSVVVDSPGAHWAWRNRYTLTLAPLELPALRWDVELPADTRPVKAALPNEVAHGDCFLDQVNGTPVSRSLFSAGAIVTLSGWALWNALPAEASDDIQIGLSNGSQTYRLHARAVTRGDVAAAYKLPPSLPVGFEALGDLSGPPPGDYKLYAVVRHGSETRSCALNHSLLIGNDGVAAGSVR